MTKLSDEDRVFMEYWDKIKDHPDIKNRGPKTAFSDKYFVFFTSAILDNREYERTLGSDKVCLKRTTAPEGVSETCDVFNVTIDKPNSMEDYLFTERLGRVTYDFKVLLSGDFKAKHWSHGINNSRILWSNVRDFGYFTAAHNFSGHYNKYIHIDKNNEWSFRWIPQVFEKHLNNWERYKNNLFRQVETRPVMDYISKKRYKRVNENWQNDSKEGEPLYELAKICDPFTFVESFLYEKNADPDFKSSKKDRLEFAKHIEEKLRIMQAKDVQPVEYRLACVIAENNPEAFEVEFNENGLKVFKVKAGLQFIIGQCKDNKVSFENLKQYISGDIIFYPNSTNA